MTLGTLKKHNFEYLYVQFYPPSLISDPCPCMFTTYCKCKKVQETFGFASRHRSVKRIVSWIFHKSYLFLMSLFHPSSTWPTYHDNLSTLLFSKIRVSKKHLIYLIARSIKTIPISEFFALIQCSAGARQLLAFQWEWVRAPANEEIVVVSVSHI